MKKGFQKSLCLLLALLMLACVAMLTVSAEESAREWTVSEDLSNLSDGNTTYYLYPIPTGYEWSPWHSIYYYYNDSVMVRETGIKVQASLQSTTSDSGIILVRMRGETRLYATREAAQVLTDYFSATSHTNCFLWENYTYGSAISNELLSRFYDPTQVDPLEVDVTELPQRLCYELVTFDPNLALVKTIGAVYQLDEELYGFVDYTLLDNTHFDASGNFSYRSGSVTLSVLKGDAYAALTETVAAMENVDRDSLFENDPDMEAAGLLIFWIFFVFVGYVLPLVPLFLGLLIPITSRRRGSKRWFLLAVFAGIWLLAATVILIILL